MDKFNIEKQITEHLAGIKIGESGGGENGGGSITTFDGWRYDVVGNLGSGAAYLEAIVYTFPSNPMTGLDSERISTIESSGRIYGWVDMTADRKKALVVLGLDFKPADIFEGIYGVSEEDFKEYEEIAKPLKAFFIDLE